MTGNKMLVHMHGVIIVIVFEYDMKYVIINVI